ncbi:hypothetical protein JOD97_000025 [Duganella sp. 1411]|uniref:hypothetical protein n=1 Tax=Duganella sp. 1411 TaxID=2806572 RepID=UPI001AE7840F|nr:hypothetical protein [Duganella sp. 1411]MBP1202011.1 hypothetical protein [Duganella sp. 1411]
MTEITLVLPYALPPPEMARDLIRALQTPALAALLSRHSDARTTKFDNNSRVLPHEAWLSHALGLAPAPDHPDTGAPVATAAMRGCGPELAAAAAAGHWFIVQPANIQISRTHSLLSDPRALQLTEAESRSLYDIARPYFEELGKPLLYAAPGLWFVRADDWSGLRTASPDAATTQYISDWVPEGERARDYRKLQNEIQMLWHEHPVNEARHARGLQQVNSFWLWGGSALATPPAAVPLWVAADGAPSWMQALAAPERRAPDVARLLAAPANNATVVLAELIPPAQTGDWADWLARLQRLELEWFAPLLAALKEGRVGRVTLVMSHRHEWMTVSGSKLAQRKFWRKQNLNILLSTVRT